MLKFCNETCTGNIVMVGMAEISTALAGINGAITIGKAIRQADGAIETAELKLQLAELMTNLADAKMALAEMGDAISAKDVEIERLTEAFAFKGETIEYDHFLYKKHETGVPIGRPFCPNCLESSGRHILTQKVPNAPMRTKQCPNCKSSYVASDRPEPQPE